MNRKEASEMLGITYGQLRYLVERIDAITKKETSQGYATELTPLDVAYLKLATIMRADKFTIDDINEAFSLIEYAIKTEGIICGCLIHNRTNNSWKIESAIVKGKWLWTRNVIQYGNNRSDILTHIPGALYNLEAIVEAINATE